jgi:hypothetical protein
MNKICKEKLKKPYESFPEALRSVRVKEEKDRTCMTVGAEENIWADGGGGGGK